jgi:other hect domain ubiquitin protein ligase E3
MAFEVKLKGEMVQGEGGPYRAFFADVSSELQPSAISSHQRNLHLLIPSVNNQRREGESRDKFVVHPNAKSSYQL